jgi:hypothetical protein
MRTLILALLLVAVPALGGTPKAPYKKYSKADVVRVYGKPLSLEMKAMAWRAKTRLEAAEILHDIFLDTQDSLLVELKENGRELVWESPELVRRAWDLCTTCTEYARSLDEVIEYYRKVDKR